ncbi:MAG: sterol desaturase family protein, partial [Candidatus Hydrogenedentes bacterium]|nr:sterol desaturase family protein [Candidatus Hydrogenedentota bacterium]
TPRRVLTGRRVIRWVSNLGLVVLSGIAVPLVLPVASLAMAQMAVTRGWGLFNNYEWPHALVFVLCVVALDFVIYVQHVLFHAVPALWKLHQVHHSDIDLDATSGLRFHVIQIVLSMLVKLAAIVTLGPPVLAVLAFEVILNGTALFNHANIKLPLRVDAVLRLFVVTPDMHRVHHSVIRCETDSNYGFNLSIWDRFCGTYCAQPREGHEGMTIGVNAFREERDQWLDRLLLQPFRNSPEKDKEAD